MADKCQDHPTHELKLFCDTCKVALCAECSVINHRPPEHTNRYLSDVAEEYRQELMQMTEQLKEKEESDKRTESVAMATQNSLTLKFEMEKKKLSERASEIVRNVKERETQLMRELETEYSLYQKRSELQIEKIKIEKESVHSTLGNIENIIESNNATSLIKTIGQKGNEVGQFNKPTGVIVNHDGDIVVADKGNDRLQVINRNGQCKHIIEYKKFCKKYKCSPFDVAISSNGLYYSLDVAHNIVVVTDDEGNILRYFGMGKLKAPTGVTIGPDGLVYIVDCYVIAHIKIFTQEGEFVRSFICNKSKLSIPFSVVVSNHRKVYMVDSNVGRIAVYYENGTFLYDVPIGGKPQGLAIDKDGYLYVTFFENKIIKFDETGNIIGRIDKDSDNINKPTGIIVTDDMKIVVADTGNHCVRVFV
ncbi:E3 ubiquitin-protein ligase TRIM71-like [Saccoglossus kowalevskii]|uniref:Tripartite motif-containing protein 2-like n=1 Tax=Saccoglossus kowalevskii TaxID=10224 RepID=A0ABM0M825_SACKO|nr:PREDICTED: tripartite motif-containing protein 2-like [Saccoglossus kowalevskii]